MFTGPVRQLQFQTFKNMQKPSEFQGKSRCLDCLAHLQFIPAHAKAWFLLASADAPFQPRCARSKELLVPVAHPTGQFGWKLLSPSGWFFFNFTCNLLETAVKVGYLLSKGHVHFQWDKFAPHQSPTTHGLPASHGLKATESWAQN